MFPETTPALANVLHWASRPTDDAELRRFLRRRLAVYVKLVVMLFGGLYVVGALALLFIAPAQFWTVHVHPGKIINLLMTLGAFAFLFVLRRWEPSERALRAADIGFVLTMALGMGIGSATAPQGYHFEIISLLVMILLLVLRAALVPSQPLFTAIVGVLCSIPVLVGGYLQVRGAPMINDFLTPGVIVLALSMWCVVATAATTVVSRVIYGLVSQVRDAMHLGRYTLGAKIGEGGMGEVYRAEHAMLRRPTAVKLLLPSKVSASSLERFEREVQLTSRLSHPNTIAIYDYGRTPNGIFYYAMEYLDGLSLESLVASDGMQPPGRVVHILLQTAGALAEAHGIGLIHRDIKPANIMLCKQGGECDVVKLLDFGLVKEFEVDRDVKLTGASAVIGTPQYMAPESILEPNSVDARTDIYALGAAAYYLLAGVDVFNGKSIVEVLGQHLHQRPESLSARGVAIPAELEAIVLACLDKNPARRPQSAAELRRRVEACRVEPWDSERARVWWSEHQRDLDGDAGESTGAPRTLAVDGAHRSSSELAG
jgi:serine/threonine-protein kinase